MDQNTGAAGTQVDPATQPQVGATQTAQAASAEPILDAEALQRELLELRKSEVRYRHENKRLTDAQAATERATLTEQERIQRDRTDFDRERTEFERERQDFRLREAVTRAAGALGFVDPEDAYLMLDRTGVEFGEDGKPRGLERQLRELLARKPHLLSPSRTATVTRGVQPGGNSSGDWNSALRRVAGVQPD